MKLKLPAPFVEGLYEELNYRRFLLIYNAIRGFIEVYLLYEMPKPFVEVFVFV